ncbi:hypothetical protein EGW08_012058 [Elysia chlorotica]|uniref:Uncharacterized protein n=1 Tax=Elysia chlorotica TaxID=188477 RepID=A0A3S1HIJ7_ELYCH|nr:hypothetical protein EGW08_012058 [Elysia chlorotica]
MSDTEHIQTISRNIVRDVLLSSVNLLHEFVPERHCESREPSMVVKDTQIVSDSSIAHAWRSISSLASDDLTSSTDFITEARRRSQEPISHDSDASEPVNALDKHKNLQLRIEINMENSFSEKHIMQASSPRSSTEKDSDQNPSGIIPGDIFHPDKGEQQDSGPLSLSDLQHPEGVAEGAGEPKDSAFYEEDLGKDMFESGANVNDTENPISAGNVDAEKEYYHNAVSLSPRYHYYTEGDSGFFDPCDSTASREDSEVNVAQRGASFQAGECRDDHSTSNSRTKTTRPKIRPEDANPRIEEEVEIQESACAEPDTLALSNSLVSNQSPKTLAPRPRVERTENEHVSFKTSSNIEVGSDNPLEEAAGSSNEIDTGEQDISSTSVESFYFRKKIFCTKEDFDPSDIQAEFRRVSGDSSLYSNVSFQSEDFSQDEITYALQVDPSQVDLNLDMAMNEDFETEQEIETDFSMNNIALCTYRNAHLSVNNQDTDRDLYKITDFEPYELARVSTITHELPSDQDYNQNKELEKVKTSEGISIGVEESSVDPSPSLDIQSPTIYQAIVLDATQIASDHNISKTYRLLDPTQDCFSDNPQVQLYQNPHKTSKLSSLNVQSTSFDHNSRSLSHPIEFVPSPDTLFQQSLEPRDDDQMQEDASSGTERLSLDLLSTLSPRLVSLGLTPRLTPRSRSNFERLRAMHRHSHGLSADGLQLGESGSGQEGSQSSPSDNENSQTEVSKGETEGQAEGGGSHGESQESSSSWILGIYKGVCHALSKPDMPYMG